MPYAVMEIITVLSCTCSSASQDSVLFDGLCKDADDLEKQYTDAVTRASTVLASMSRYNSTCTSEATGVRYSRNPDRVRQYLESVSAARTVRTAQDQLQLRMQQESTHMQSSTTCIASDSVVVVCPWVHLQLLCPVLIDLVRRARPSRCTIEYHEYGVDQGPPDCQRGPVCGAHR